MPVPDVIGAKLASAVESLEAAGLRYRVVETVPPRRPRPEGPSRVLRQTLDGDGTVCLLTSPAEKEPFRAFA
jgi:beta-lactam-binding protein with PASTA domain